MTFDNLPDGVTIEVFPGPRPQFRLYAPHRSPITGDASLFEHPRLTVAQIVTALLEAIPTHWPPDADTSSWQQFH